MQATRIGGSWEPSPGETEEKQRNTGRKNTGPGEHVPFSMRGLGPKDTSGDDDESAAEREALEALGSNVYPSLFERARAEGITDTRAMVRRALELARDTEGEAS